MEKIAQHVAVVDQWWLNQIDPQRVLLENEFIPDLANIVVQYLKYTPHPYPNKYGYVDEKGNWEGLWIGWFDNGNIWSMENYHNGKPEGKSAYFNSNGNPFKEEYYHNGKREGLSTEWWSSGAIGIQGIYHNGKREGVWTWWNEDGTIQRMQNYHDGQLIQK